MEFKLSSLTPTDKLGEKGTGEVKEFDTYKEFLDEAFKDSSIHNIALSGSLGSGKSSIIRSYDRSRNYGTKNFLYVSLASFSSKSRGLNNQKQLEYNLLTQILSYTSDKDLPEGSISGIPERFRWLRLSAIRLSLLLFAVYILLFQQQLWNIAKNIIQTSNYEEVKVCCSVLLIILYIYVGLEICALIYRVMRHFLPLLRISKLTIKANSAEAEMIVGRERTYLDMYKFELVYVLEKIAKEHDYTIVFEDLERLAPDTAVCIMEKLRELNTLTNNHIQTMNPKRWFKFLRKYVYMLSQKFKWSLFPHLYKKLTHLILKRQVRFIYAVSENPIGSNRTKFFDYIIPVKPFSHALNSREHLRNILSQLHIEGDYRESLLDALSDAFIDYRTCLTLKNEFALLFRVSELENKADDRLKATVLAISAYKVLSPKNFERELSPSGRGILSNFKNADDPKLILEFVDDKERRQIVYNALNSLFNKKLLYENCLNIININKSSDFAKK